MRAPVLFPALALALWLPLCAASQTSRSPTPPDSGAWLPASAIRNADYAERRLPLLVQENRALRSGLQACAATDEANRRALAASDSAQAATNRQLAAVQQLRADGNHRAAVAEKKARGRFWLIVGETAALIGLVLLSAVGH